MPFPSPGGFLDPGIKPVSPALAARFFTTESPVRTLLVAQSCPTLCDPMDCRPPGSAVHRDSPDKNTGVACHALLQVIFPTQVFRIAGGFFTIRTPLKPKNTEMGSPSLLQMNFLTQESNRGLLHRRWVLYQAELPGKPPRYLAQEFSPVISTMSCYMETPGDQVNKKAKFSLWLF